MGRPRQEYIVLTGKPSSTPAIRVADPVDSLRFMFGVGIECSYPLIDGTSAADIELHGVAVGKDALVATPGAAVALLEEAMDRAALAQVGAGCGDAARAAGLLDAGARPR